MSMVRTIPKKLTELGRIRIGDREINSSGKGTHPHKLSTFRLTSPNRSLLLYASQAYGGEVKEWDDEWAPHDEHARPTQYELYTNVNALDVLIPTFSAISLSFERWSASGCQQRCTGEVITACPLEESRIGHSCTCPPDDLARAELARTGKACARILRLNVLLDALPGVGVWRLETKGFYATAELMGTLEMLEMAGQEHLLIDAVLRLEQRTVKRPGKGEGKGTLQFAVPTLWPKYTFRQIAAAGQQRGFLMAAPASDAEQKSLAAHVGDLFGDDAQAVMERLDQATEDPGIPRTPGALDPAEFAWRLEAIWSGGGLTADEMAKKWLSLQKRCGSPIPERWYGALLEEQQAWVATRRAPEDWAGTTEGQDGEEAAPF